LTEDLGEARKELAGERLPLAGLQKDVADVLAVSTELKEKPDASETEERELEREWPLPTESKAESFEPADGLERRGLFGMISLGSEVVLVRRGGDKLGK
jgi:hypothetical protein